MSEQPKEDENQEQPKKEENQEQPNVETEEQPKKTIIDESPKTQKEPEPKIPSDVSELVKLLEKIKKEGNDLFKENDLDNAIKKYKEGYKEADKIMEQFSKERDYNPGVLELEKLKKQILQNLALSYSKIGEHKRVIEIDTKIISIDDNFDKSYARLFMSHRALGNKPQAIYFGRILKKKFKDETLEKFKDILPEIDNEILEYEKEINEYKAQQRKENLKSIAKYAIPLVVLVTSGLIYFYFIKK